MKLTRVRECVPLALEAGTAALAARLAISNQSMVGANPGLNIMVPFFGGPNILNAVFLHCVPSVQFVLHAGNPQVELGILLMLQFLVFPVPLCLVGERMRGMGEDLALLSQDVGGLAGFERG